MFDDSFELIVDKCTKGVQCQRTIYGCRYNRRWRSLVWRDKYLMKNSFPCKSVYIHKQGRFLFRPVFPRVGGHTRSRSSIVSNAFVSLISLHRFLYNAVDI